ncbi:MAG: primosomal protein N' [Candidatus Marinimicrobia bacterium]|nr:primosomal protein N' [Candidatus Neomarinimicrobiota bacterium]
MFADVSFPISSYQVFTYRIPKSISGSVEVGVRVCAPFGTKKNAQGVVVNLKKKAGFKGKIRSIGGIIDETPIFGKTLWELINWVSQHYMTPLGQVMRSAVPARLSRSYSPPEQLMVQFNGISDEALMELEEKAPRQFQVIRLLENQETDVPVAGLNPTVPNAAAVCWALEKKGHVSLSRVPRIPDVSDLSITPVKKEVKFSKAQEQIVAEMEAKLKAGAFSPYLLHGVTGSGKTEIYIHLAQRAEEKGRHSILLLPEIALTPQIAGRFRAVFGEKVAIWHSRMTKAERAWTWHQICADAFSVVVGARSAIFTPLKDVGLIVVDEEQESGFKQESPAPRYHARDVALMRGKLSSALTVLAGATPSMESYYNQAVGKLNYLRLKRRYGVAKYPRVHMVNMTTEREETEDYSITLSRLLQEKMKDRFKKGEQIILLQNRRGFAPVVSCRDCGFVEMCNQCQISLTFHRVDERLKCHYCNFEKPSPALCPACDSTRIVLGGTGTQKVEEKLIELFPEIKCVRMDLDTTRGKGAYTRILTKFSEGEYDVLLGTQMIAKGLDFPNVTLVGIINADTGLHLPDFRAGERTFQLIYQVAGRSGRGDKPGEVIIQSNDPDHSVIKAAARLDLEKYYNVCLSERRELMYAPFSWMAKVELYGKKREAVAKRAETLLKHLQNRPKHLEVLGPAPCPIERLRGNYRYQIIFKSSKEKDQNGQSLRRFLEDNLVDRGFLKRKKGVTLRVDVDPVSLL